MDENNGNGKSLDSVKATIAKLITLANDKGATPAEAALAMERAEKIMAKYNLTQAEIFREQLKSKGKLSATREDADCYWTERTHSWEAYLANGIALVFESKVVIISGFDTDHEKVAFVGMPDDVALCLYFFDYCQNEVGRHMELAYSKKKEQNEFAWGMMQHIVDRLKELYTRIREASTCTDLIVVKKDAVMETFRDHFPSTRSMNSRRPDNSKAFVDGWIAGGKTHLSSNRDQLH